MTGEEQRIADEVYGGKVEPPPALPIGPPAPDAPTPLDRLDLATIRTLERSTDKIATWRRNAGYGLILTSIAWVVVLGVHAFCTLPPIEHPPEVEHLDAAEMFDQPQQVGTGRRSG